MAPRSSKSLKTKEVKIPHLTVANKKKMGTWDLGGLFAVDWSRTYEDLEEELAGHQKAAVPKYEYRGKPRAWTSYVWREVYNFPKANLRGYIMKRKVQFIELQLLKVVKGDQRQSKFKVFLEQVEGDFDFVLFCQMLNVVLAPIRIKALGFCNEATCLGLYLVHLYNHFHEMDAEEKEDSKKRKALIQTVSDSDTKTEDEKEPKEEVPHTIYGGKANGTEAVACNMKEIFAPPPVAEVDIQLWKEMVKNLIKFLTEEQKKNKEVV
ncbi:hypothetical protein R1flu_022656 [Riccia fluitans]|uniref:Uncharacterized protein n=1 Tax=Riccia fluitans TaxID=41844 RepID=A0ABD1XQB0_9MARC